MAQNKNPYQKSRPKDRISWAMLLFIWSLYSYFSLQTPSTQAMAKYQLDDFQLSLLKLSIAVPILFIWSAILYSFLKLNDYSQTIIQSEDGQGFHAISRGVFFMLVSSVSSSYISLIIQFSQNDQAVMKSLRIINNYVVVFLGLLSFYLIWKGSKKLISLVHAEKKVRKQGKLILFVTTLLALPYIYFVLQNPLRSISNTPGINSTYNLPDVLIFTTIVMPYILTWLLGIYSVVNMSVFKEETDGVIYKKVLDKFYKGFLTVIILVISLQYLTQFSLFFSQASISIVLIIVYLILFVNIVGLILVAEGVKQLTKIETI